MCGRFTTRLTPAELVEAFGLAGVEEAPARALPARFNISPRQDVPVVTNQGPRLLRAFRWGLVPWWAKDLRTGDRLINARIESLGQRPAFRAGERNRCLVLADGFYEWKRERGRKQPFFFELEGAAPFAFAGIWDRWHEPAGTTLHSCLLLTQAATGEVARVHDRMPIVLPRRLYETWLSPEAVPLAVWKERLRKLSPPFRSRRVSPYVNVAEHEGPGCLAPPPASPG
ncbi:MAG TPA: SOS response-associated peptidase [Myxococcaceae bacterium]|jgi:putative SOS response-associated peptidase YedK|nr:SOS response-associated peptidase [Myxococcaceae bacterium]